MISDFCGNARLSRSILPEQLSLSSLLRESTTAFRVTLSRNNCPEGPGPGFVGCSHSTVHLLLLQGTKPSRAYLSVQRLVSDSTTLLNPELNNSQSKKPGTTQMEYDPNDFSQAAINGGQRKINDALT